MELGVSYSCLCRAAERASWLRNILDRQASRSMCRSESPLYHQSLSQCITLHSKAVLDHLKDTDAAIHAEPTDADYTDMLAA